MRFRSVCVMAMIAPSRAVMPPMTATTHWASGEAANSGVQRATMYTPAVTIVAAWIKALTGVGPSMASGSQTCSGNWALLPHAPSSNSRQIAVASPPPANNSGEASRVWPSTPMTQSPSTQVSWKLSVP